VRELKKTINEAFNGDLTPSKKILKCCPEAPLNLRSDPRFGFPVKQQMSNNILSTETVYYFSIFKLKSLKACFATCNVAIVRPLIKKVNMDPSDLNSFRPISNLSFVAKLLERIIDARFTEHANTNNHFSPLQSAYRKHHSSETGLVKIHKDIITTSTKVSSEPSCS